MSAFDCLAARLPLPFSTAVAYAMLKYLFHLAPAVAGSQLYKPLIKSDHGDFRTYTAWTQFNEQKPTAGAQPRASCQQIIKWYLGRSIRQLFRHIHLTLCFLVQIVQSLHVLPANEHSQVGRLPGNATSELSNIKQSLAIKLRTDRRCETRALKPIGSSEMQLSIPWQVRRTDKVFRGFGLATITTLIGI
ncbi:hypothetical protein EJ03DRAFT_11294 [Teratosphaeria nubilosa]|uniref:Uncharacterized protein n=1 Tax=Teratosphaeria nubilosa TaxID=161662 RepID=A0A6G1LIC5_9PEZI|nr:hypothetical protein EJ03DRAFT_11294 [Teratosphaeria nubilosa]